MSLLDIFVHKALSADNYGVGDNSDAIVLDLSDKAESSSRVALASALGFQSLSLATACCDWGLSSILAS